ncbi:acyl-CoA dehydrogenase/oxidase C-terminal [Cryphonectria parasitica EP155]|uniref:Acyl-CoA dehydrogenase/oxidase C-terminal n=1 Tax=Cryphonectria parasitica (strain ATCC 38755 / EP155) TaxID=660469 RepID=A0A9P4XU03_CRYP1|nr:acyl-CoA dehydrogenase/oxidase C-terminal [Cryphonectria parasitica EP155]KAF3760811.1 acyl-CoA dehydrogenase/oxidase C-terminal [Cryphonectria parasitica EP155]
MEGATSDTGFFQQQPILENQAQYDPSYQRVLKLFLPPGILQTVTPELIALGDKVLSQTVFDLIFDAERNLPQLRGSGRDSFGRPRSDALVLSQGWRELQQFGIQNGIVAYNYDTDHGQYTRVVQMLRSILWEASSANTTCPVAMTDGAARLLQQNLAKPTLDQTRRRIFQNAYDHLTSRDPETAWTSGQWMTERPGGSDVSQTETVASYAPYPDSSTLPLADANESIPLGPWSISGFKWFSSATDSSMTVLLAKTSPDKGVSAFLAPMRRHSADLISPTGQRGGTELNGVRISRLKDKMGTKSLPTAELELKGMRGWLIGEEGRGIHEIATILTITRVRSCIGALGYLGRGLAVAKAYTLVRQVGATRGRRMLLCESPLHMRTLATMTSTYHAMMLLTFYATYLLGLEETSPAAAEVEHSPPGGFQPPPPPPQHVGPLLRVLSSLCKAYICKHAIPLMYGCMEALGGVGYLNNTESEHLNLSRIFRDLCVLATWEGTTDVLSTDLLRALKHPREGKTSMEALGWFLETNRPAPRAREAWREIRARVENKTQDELVAEARDICFGLAEVLMAALLEVDVESDGDATAKAMRDRFLGQRRFLELGTH